MLQLFVCTCVYGIPFSLGRPFLVVYISLYFVCSGKLSQYIMQVLASWNNWPKRPVIPTRKMSWDNDNSSRTCGKTTLKYSVLPLVLDKSLRQYSYCSTSRTFSLLLRYQYRIRTASGNLSQL